MMSDTAIRALDFVSQLALSPGHYRMTKDLGGTIHTDLFGFFTRYLLNDPYSSDEKAYLVAKILDHQDQDSGIWQTYEETGHALHDREHVNRQLTTYALSALVTLDIEPRYPLRFTQTWMQPGWVKSFLDSLDWKHNAWNSGSRAMFVAIILTYQVQYQANAKAQQSLDEWFQWHEEHARPRSGYWGTSYQCDWYIGMGGAAHQYTLYDYHQRRPPYLEQAVEQIVKMQYYDGRFWPLYGSGSCYELDAMQILMVGYRHLPQYHDSIQQVARKMIDFTMTAQNDDGGFCWANRRWFVWQDIIRSLPVTGDIGAMLWSFQKQAIAHIKRNDIRSKTVWIKGLHTIQTSSLFDTWFRLLTLAEIAQVLEDERLASFDFQPLKFVGWGYF